MVILGFIYQLDARDTGITLGQPVFRSWIFFFCFYVAESTEEVDRCFEAIVANMAIVFRGCGRLPWILSCGFESRTDY